MFRSLLEELYYDNCGQMEKIRMSDRLARFEEDAEELFGKLSAALDDEHRQWLDKLRETVFFRDTEYSYLNFRAGLQFGVRFAVEALGYMREEDARE